MGYQLTFEVSTMPLTLNQVMGKHWRSRYHNFEKIKDEIGASIKNSLPDSPITNASVYIWRYSSGKLDRDNAYFTAKPILDALVREGVIIDDGPSILKRLNIHQVKIKRTEQKHLKVMVFQDE